jgi:membrane associated rhomboid family serine protease
MFARLTPVVKNLLLINLAIFIIPGFMGLDFVDLLGLRYINSEKFQPHQIITHMFMHGGFGHLFSNMLALFIFGPMLERYLGTQRFFVFYMICGLGAGILYSTVNFVEMRQLEKEAERYIENPNAEDFSLFISKNAEHVYKQWYGFIDRFEDNPTNKALINESVERVNYLVKSQANVPMIGASGAVFGILLAFAFIFPNLQLFLLFPPIPVKAKYLVGFYGIYSLFAVIQPTAGDNVAHWAHLGGMIIGYFVLKSWRIQGNQY